MYGTGPRPLKVGQRDRKQVLRKNRMQGGGLKGRGLGTERACDDGSSMMPKLRTLPPRLRYRLLRVRFGFHKADAGTDWGM